MRTAEEILKSIDDSRMVYHTNAVNAIKIAMKEAIEECAKRVTLCGKLYCDEDDFSDVEVVNMTNKRGYIDTIIKPDKQSILNLINELK